VHRVDCPNAFEDKVGAERRVDVAWDVPDARAFVVKLMVYGSDHRGMLADVANAISDTGTNIRDAGMRAVDGDARGTFVIEVNNLSHLNSVIKAVNRVKGVRYVERSQVSGGEL
jgi:GTP pyrophosphokinase